MMTAVAMPQHAIYIYALQLFAPSLLFLENPISRGSSNESLAHAGQSLLEVQKVIRESRM
jgi:hypothetical protein